MAGEMLQKPRRGRLVTALRLAFYPAFESAEARRFQALTVEAENARGSGDLAKAEMLYSMAVLEARSSSDPSYLSRARDGLARVYQEQRRYREAERIFQDQLEAAVNSPQPNTLVHAGHMSLALLYQDEGKFVEADTHYKAALTETERTELFPGRGFWCSTSMWLAKFYIARQRYGEAEPLFQMALEIHEEDRGSTFYLPHHIQEFAKLYEAWGNTKRRRRYTDVLWRFARRSLELKERAWGERYSSFSADSLEALANVLHKIGREDEAVELDKRVEAMRLNKRTLRWRVSMFVSLILRAKYRVISVAHFTYNSPLLNMDRAKLSRSPHRGGEFRPEVARALISANAVCSNGFIERAASTVPAFSYS